MVQRRRWLGVSVLAGLSVWASLAAAEGPKPIAVAPTRAGATGAWAEKHAGVTDDVRAGKPLVIEVFVPLCSDKKGGPCGKHAGAGDPDDLEDNVYWGAVFGARRYLDRKYLGWTRTEAGKGEGFELERATYKRTVSGARWGAGSSVEVFLVLHAVQGDAGDDALERFRNVAQSGGTVRFHDGSGAREERVHVVGFMGRNPLLKNGIVPKKVELPEPSQSSSAIPSFSIAAFSRETLGPWLRGTGSRGLVLTRGAVASEGYVLDAVTRAIADNEAPWQIQKRAAKKYAEHHKVPQSVADLYFQPNVPREWQSLGLK